jgi:putative colanic acid biosynthesis UDP-glucose lipid carrier transferase
MSSLASDFHREGAELPSVATLRYALAPLVCVTTLVLSLLVHGEPAAVRYGVVAVATFFLAVQVFGELPLHERTDGLATLLPTRAVLVDWLIVFGVLLLAAFALKVSDLYSRKVMLTWFAVTPFALAAAQAVASRGLRDFAAASAALRSRVIVGANARGLALARRLEKDPCLGRVRGFFDDRASARLPGARSAPLLGSLDTVSDFVKHNAIQVVYIALPISDHPRIVRLLEGLRDTTASIYFIPSALPCDFIQARIDRIGDIPVIAVCETPLRGMNGAAKRVFDVALATAALAIAWPVMLAIAAAIRLESGAPVLFRQRRYGLDGKEILVCKFRTMRVAEDGVHYVQARRNDPRVTRLGLFLRRTSLDELPQLLNVLEGTMSIVGPRPHAVAQNEDFRRRIAGYMQRHKVRPGITGWAQVNGLRGETDTDEKMRQRVAYDLEYLRHWSLALDLWIVARTALVVVRDAAGRAY